MILSISDDAQTRGRALEALVVAFAEQRGATQTLLSAIARQSDGQERAVSIWSAPPAVLVEASARKEGSQQVKSMQKHSYHLLEMSYPERAYQDTQYIQYTQEVHHG